MYSAESHSPPSRIAFPVSLYPGRPKTISSMIKTFSSQDCFTNPGLGPAPSLIKSLLLECPPVPASAEILRPANDFARLPGRQPFSRSEIESPASNCNGRFRSHVAFCLYEFSVSLVNPDGWLTGCSGHTGERNANAEQRLADELARLVDRRCRRGHHTVRFRMFRAELEGNGQARRRLARQPILTILSWQTTCVEALRRGLHTHSFALSQISRRCPTRPEKGETRKWRNRGRCGLANGQGASTKRAWKEAEEELAPHDGFRTDSPARGASFVDGFAWTTGCSGSTLDRLRSSRDRQRCTQKSHLSAICRIRGCPRCWRSCRRMRALPDSHWERRSWNR